QVCPTGIDIRDGLQYECIGCALCIDACDQVMDKMDYPRGLIRYTTENELEGKTSKLLRPRTFGYGAVLTAMIGAVIFIVASRVPAQMDVLRDRGALYSFNGEGRIENSYTIKIQNMSEVPQTFVLSVEGLKDMRIITDTTVKVASGENRSLPTVVDVPPESIQSTNSDIRFIATSQTDSSLILETESRFVGPRAR
ncbi:MAG: 4Fe-4S ferredoxin, partial [Marinobacter sp. T13-3]